MPYFAIKSSVNKEFSRISFGAKLKRPLEPLAIFIYLHLFRQADYRDPAQVSEMSLK